MLTCTSIHIVVYSAEKTYHTKPYDRDANSVRERERPSKVRHMTQKLEAQVGTPLSITRPT